MESRATGSAVLTKIYRDGTVTNDQFTVKHFVWPVRIYYEDTDSSGVVYYANYLKFMERARTEWLRSLGFEQDELSRSQRVLFAVRSLALDYHRPARFNDLLEVRSRVEMMRGASLTFQQLIVCISRATETLCSGRIRIACVDVDSFRPRSIPRPILREMVGGN
jgi:acyl-CoA thioester hydrolase